MRSPRKVWLAVLGVAAVAFAAVPARAVEPPKWVPADAEAVVVFNIKQTLNSPLVKTYALKELEDALKGDEKLNKLLKATGIDPLKDIDSLMLTASDIAGKNELLFAVAGKFDLEKMHAAAKDYAEKNPKELNVTGKGDARVYEITVNGQTAFASLPDASTILVAKSKEFLEATVKKGNSAKVNKDLVSALDKVKGGKESLWGASVINDEMRKSLAANPTTKDLATKLDSVTGGMNVGDDLKVGILVHTTDPRAAKTIATELNKLKPLLMLVGAQSEQAQPFINLIVENLKIGSKETVADIQLQLTADQIKKAAEPDKDK